MMVSEAQTLVKEGNAALLAGDAYEARQRFRRALELEPDNVEALIGMAGTVRPYQEKREYLHRALTLDPSHGEARDILAYVEGKIAAGEVLAPRGVTMRDPETSPIALSAPPEPAAPPTEVMFCYNHPDRETGLTCTSCGRPICGQCMVRAPVGQLCPECARARRPPNYQVSTANLAVVVAVTLMLTAVVGLVVTLFLSGFFAFILAFIGAPIVGDLLVRLLDRLTRVKRGRAMQIATGISIGLGALTPILGISLLVGQLVLPPLALLLFTIIMIATAVARLR